MIPHRRHRHFNPASAGATLALDARFITGKADGDTVASWASRAPASASVAEAIISPVYKAAIFGGQPVVRFDGTKAIGGAFTLTGYCTVVAALAMRNGADAYARAVSMSKSGGADYTSTTVYVPVLRNAGGEAVNTYYNHSGYNSRSITYGTAFIAGSIYGSGSLATGVNGSYATSTPSTSALDVDHVNIGEALNVSLPDDKMDGDLAAVAIFPFAISDALRRRVEQSLAFSFRIPCA